MNSDNNRTIFDLVSSYPDYPWSKFNDERLLDLKFKDLGIQMRHSPLKPVIQLIMGEVKKRQLLIKPHFWYSTEWFCPDGVPGIGVPFYLAHPRLAELEKKMMLEAEGVWIDQAQKILRHELGHVVENAFRTRRKQKRQKHFGHSTDPYPDFYLPKPYSKSYVLHLDSWYAQSHSDEDFAETFAVWLNPFSYWKIKYKNWPAYKKLLYMDELMKELADKEPPVNSLERVDESRTLNYTLREYYQQKKETYGLNYPNFYDRDLLKLFATKKVNDSQISAYTLIKKIKKDVLKKVTHWTGTYRYTVNQVIVDIQKRSLDLNLYQKQESLETTKLNFTIMLTVQTMNYLSSGRHRVVL